MNDLKFTQAHKDAMLNADTMEYHRAGYYDDEGNLHTWPALAAAIVDGAPIRRRSNDSTALCDTNRATRWQDFLNQKIGQCYYDGRYTLQEVKDRIATFPVEE